MTDNIYNIMLAADAIEELSKRVTPVPHGRLIDADIDDAPTVIEATIKNEQ